MTGRHALQMLLAVGAAAVLQRTARCWGLLLQLARQLGCWHSGAWTSHDRPLVPLHDRPLVPCTAFAQQAAAEPACVHSEADAAMGRPSWLRHCRSHAPGSRCRLQPPPLQGCSGFARAPGDCCRQGDGLHRGGAPPPAAAREARLRCRAALLLALLRRLPGAWRQADRQVASIGWALAPDASQYL